MLNSSTQSRPRSRRIAAALAVAGVLSTAACSGGSGGQPGGGAERTDVMNIAIQSQPRSFDPAQVTDGEAGMVWNAVYDTLLWFNNDDEIEGNAAESWEYSEDKRTLTLKMRPGMTFSNGNKVTAEAARATLERTRKTPGGQSLSLSQVASVAAPDESTLVITLKKPDPGLLFALTQGAGVVGDPSTFDDPDLALKPIGSGGYTLSKETVDGSTYVLERRDDHWNAKALPFKKVTVRKIQNRTATVNALQAGEINVGGVLPNATKQLEAAGFEISRPVPIATGAIVLLDREGTITKALTDVRVRKALNMAFDRQGFVDSVLQKAAEPTTQFANPDNDLYVKELEGNYTYDPAAARKLLAEAGYPNGFELKMPLTLLALQLKPLIDTALKDIGVTVDWTPQPPTAILSSLQSKDFSAAVWFAGHSPTVKEAQDRFGENALLNPFGVKVPELTKLMDEVATETDEGKRRELYQEIGRFASEQALAVPLFNNTVLYATKGGIDFLPKSAPAPSVRRWGFAD